MPRHVPSPPSPMCVGESLGGKGQQVGDRAMSPWVPAPHLSSPLGSSRKHLAAGGRGLRVQEERTEAPGAERQAALGHRGHLSASLHSASGSQGGPLEGRGFQKSL